MVLPRGRLNKNLRIAAIEFGMRLCGENKDWVSV